MKLSEISGIQPKAWALLARACQSNRVASTYLFSGREGLGQWQLALSFAALLNCTARQAVESDALLLPCNECDSCRQIASLNSANMYCVVPIPPISSVKGTFEAEDGSRSKKATPLDLTIMALELKRKEPFHILISESQLTLPIDQAREIKTKMSLAVPDEVTRVILFYQMDKMLHASADVLLKFIEEPPRNTVVIMTADNPETLLPTIRSRAQMIRLERVPERQIAGYLATVYDIPQEKGLLFARVTDGNLGRAIELANNEETEELSQRTTGFLLFKSLFLGSSPDTVSLAMELVPNNDRGQYESLLRFWGTLVRDCAHYAVTGEEDQIMNCDFTADIIKLAQSFADPSLASTITLALKNALADSGRNVHIQTSVAALSLRLGAAIRATR